MTDDARPTHRRAVGRALVAIGTTAVLAAVVLVALGVTRTSPSDSAVLEIEPVSAAVAPTTVPTLDAPADTTQRAAAGTERGPVGTRAVAGNDSDASLRPLSPLAARLGDRGSALPEPVAAHRVPTSVTIGDLELWAPVRPVGLEPDGEMEVPDETEVGWYRLGASPGRAGATVLAAHVTWNGTVGPFHRLGSLEPGARVEVDLDDGTTRTYQVVERAMYGKLELPQERIWRTNGPEELVLITCGGSFDESIRRYRDNIVVYAVPVA